MNNLPYEILEIIFQQLSHRDIRQCSITCHAWKLAAQHILFRHLPPLTDQQMSDLITALFFSSQRESPGDFVKTFSCYSLSNYFNVALLDTLFPNLEAIHLAEDQQVLYEKIYKLIMEGRFLNLKKVPVTRWNRKHMNLILAQKDSITELNIRSGYNETVTKEMYEKLHLFPKLEVLKIHHSCFENRILYLENLLSNISSTLKTIEIDVTSSSELVLNPPVPDLNKIEPLPNVKKVKISGYQLYFGGEETYSYIMKKFPNVTMLKICTGLHNKALETGAYILPTAELISQFLIYLFNIKEHSSVPSIITDHLTTKVIKNLFNHVNNQTRSATSKTTKIELSIGFLWLPYCYAECRSAHVMSRNFYRDNRKICQVEAVYKLSPHITHQPHLDLLREMGNTNVESLIYGNDGLRLLSTKVTAPLSIIFDHCTNLKKLRLNEITHFTLVKNKLKSPSVLESLKFYRCNLSKCIFPKISERCSNLKTLSINTCRPVSREVFINMPYTRLNELHFRMCLQEDLGSRKHDSAIIRLRTANKRPRYCKVRLQDSSDLSGQDTFHTEFNSLSYDFSETDYGKFANDKMCLVFDVYCEAVTKLTVKADSAWGWLEDMRKRHFLEEDL